MLSLQSYEGRWRPPIVKTEATTGKGVADLLDKVRAFREYTASAQTERRRARAEWRVRELLAHRFVQHVRERVLGGEGFEAMLDRIAARETDPYTAVDEVLGRTLR
jgi:LAO/AO transport system kinase